MEDQTLGEAGGALLHDWEAAQPAEEDKAVGKGCQAQVGELVPSSTPAGPSLQGVYNLPLTNDTIVGPP